MLNLVHVKGLIRRDEGERMRRRRRWHCGRSWRRGLHFAVPQEHSAATLPHTCSATTFRDSAVLRERLRCKVRLRGRKEWNFVVRKEELLSSISLTSPFRARAEVAATAKTSKGQTTSGCEACIAINTSSK